MDETSNPASLQELLDRIEAVARRDDELSIKAILQSIGRRSFGPVLLVAGLITLAPLVGDVPGVPTLIGLLVLLIAIQLLLGREHIWLPNWLLRRSIASEKAVKAVGWSRRPAKWVDRVLKPRLTVLAEGKAFYVIAALSVAIAALMPLMEVVPFSANAAGAALTAMGLALISRDGLLALIAVTIVAATVGLIIYNLVG